MKRNVVHLMMLNMLINTMLFVPKIMIDNRYKGAMTAILLTVVLGAGMLYVFNRLLKTMPGESIPELMRTVLPGWLRSALFLYASGLFYLAGAVTLMSYTAISQVFISPQLHSMIISLTFLAPVIYGMRLKSGQQLHFVKLVLLLVLPLVLLMFVKITGSEYMQLDSIRVAVTEGWGMPTWTALTASTYIYSGIFNMAIFNRTASGTLRWWELLFMLGLGLFTLLHSTLVPIGFHGPDAAAEYIFPWVVTADSVRMEFGPVERVLYIYLLAYLLISLMSVTIHWHVASQLLESIPIPRLSPKLAAYGIAGLFSLIMLGLSFRMNGEITLRLAKIYLSLRLPSELLMIGAMYFCLRRRRVHEGASSQ